MISINWGNSAASQPNQNVDAWIFHELNWWWQNRTTNTDGII